MTDEEAKVRLEELKAKEAKTPEELDEEKALEAQLGVKQEEPGTPSEDGGSLNIGG